LDNSAHSIAQQEQIARTKFWEALTSLLQEVEAAVKKQQAASQTKE
jgi:hypothetical protein